MSNINDFVHMELFGGIHQNTASPGYFQDETVNKMFETLPPIVQETILQSGAKPKNIQQLQNLADAFR